MCQNLEGEGAAVEESCRETLPGVELLGNVLNETVFSYLKVLPTNLVMMSDMRRHFSYF